MDPRAGRGSVEEKVSLLEQETEPRFLGGRNHRLITVLIYRRSTYRRNIMRASCLVNIWQTIRRHIPVDASCFTETVRGREQEMSGLSRDHSARDEVSVCPR